MPSLSFEILRGLGRYLNFVLFYKMINFDVGMRDAEGARAQPATGAARRARRATPRSSPTTRPTTPPSAATGAHTLHA